MSTRAFPQETSSSSLRATLFLAFPKGCQKMGRLLKIHPLFEPNSPTKSPKGIETHTSHNSPPKSTPVTWRKTRQSIPDPDTAPPQARLLYACSAVTAERNARARFQTDPTWRWLAVRMRGARRLGRLGEGRGPPGKGGAAERLVALGAGKCSFSLLIFRGGGCLRTASPSLPCTLSPPPSPLLRAPQRWRQAELLSAGSPGLCEGMRWGRRLGGRWRLPFDFGLPAFTAQPSRIRHHLHGGWRGSSPNHFFPVSSVPSTSHLWVRPPGLAASPSHSEQMRDWRREFGQGRDLTNSLGTLIPREEWQWPSTDLGTLSGSPEKGRLYKQM